jgi:biotin transporter BioY
MERGKTTFFRALSAACAGELVLFLGGLGWLAILTHSLGQAFRFGLYWFVFAEVIKIMLATGLSQRLRRSFRVQG